MHWFKVMPQWPFSRVTNLQDFTHRTLAIGLKVFNEHSWPGFLLLKDVLFENGCHKHAIQFLRSNIGFTERWARILAFRASKSCARIRASFLVHGPKFRPDIDWWSLNRCWLKAISTMFHQHEAASSIKQHPKLLTWSGLTSFTTNLWSTRFSSFKPLKNFQPPNLAGVSATVILAKYPIYCMGARSRRLLPIH